MNYIKDLLPIYKTMVPSLQRRYYELHPAGDNVSCRQYVQRQILRRARQMIDWPRVNALLAREPLDVPQLLLAHKSWAERGCGSDYYVSLDAYLRQATTVLDIGCGFNPLYVLSYYPNIKDYCCVDKDEKVLRVLIRICKREFACHCSFVRSIRDLGCESSFDFVFAQKIIPILYRRHNRQELARIGLLRVKWMLLTGSVRSLSRNIEICTKEKHCLNKFCEEYGLKKCEPFNKENEIGFLITKEMQ